MLVSPSFIPASVARRHLSPEAVAAERPGAAARELVARLGLPSCRAVGINWFCCGYSRGSGASSPARPRRSAARGGRRCCRAACSSKPRPTMPASRAWRPDGRGRAARHSRRRPAPRGSEGQAPFARRRDANQTPAAAAVLPRRAANEGSGTEITALKLVWSFSPATRRLTTKSMDSPELRASGGLVKEADDCDDTLGFVDSTPESKSWVVPRYTYPWIPSPEPLPT